MRARLLKRSAKDPQHDRLNKLVGILLILESWYSGLFMGETENNPKLERVCKSVQAQFNIGPYATQELFRFIYLEDAREQEEFHAIAKDFAAKAQQNITIRTGPGVRRIQSWTSDFEAVTKFASDYRHHGIIVGADITSHDIMFNTETLKPAVADLIDEVNSQVDNEDDIFDRVFEVAKDLMSELVSKGYEQETVVCIEEAKIKHIWIYDAMAADDHDDDEAPRNPWKPVI